MGSGALGDAGLFVAHQGYLLHVVEGKLAWWVPITEALGDVDAPSPLWHSAPATLADGTVFITAFRRAGIFSPDGKVLEAVELEECADDSGPSPAVLPDGERVITSPAGDVYLWEGGRVRNIGRFGYDILPPAVFPDGTLLVSGYAGEGLARVTPRGSVRWSGRPAEADLVATINDHGESAVGVLNTESSAVQDENGDELFQLPAAALFGVTFSGEWVAITQHELRRLTRDGATDWALPIAGETQWGGNGPVIDQLDGIWLIDRGELCRVADDGRTTSRLPIGTEAAAVFPAGERLLAVLTPDSLRILD